MKKWLNVLILTLIFAFVLSACGSKDLLIGTWSETTSGITLKFADDGSVTMSKGDTSFTMTYEKQDPNLLVIKASTDGSIPDQTMTYTVSKEELTLTVDGTSTVFKRAK